MKTEQHEIKCPHCEKQFPFLMITGTKEEAQEIQRAIMSRPTRTQKASHMNEAEQKPCEKCGRPAIYCQEEKVLQYNTFPLKGYYCERCWMRLLAFWS